MTEREKYFPNMIDADCDSISCNVGMITVKATLH